MTRQLHTDKHAYREIATLAADSLGYEQSHVEKDYWLSKILKDICMSDYRDMTYFKGGTSLSKAYGLIERFSEDLDLFVFTGNVNSSKQAEKTLNKNVSEFIIEHSGCIYREELSKRGGNFNMLCFSYDNLFEYVGLKGNLEVEIKACDLADKTGMYYPSELRRIEPIVGQYLEETGRTNLIEEFCLEGFETWCISPKRTICDKILRLARISYGENAVEQIVKYIRDIYDLTVILRNDDYARFVASEDFCKAISLVTQEDSKNRLAILPDFWPKTRNMADFLPMTERKCIFDKIISCMKYDFDTVVPRRGTNSLKWELADEDVLPMWVADMDFKTAPPVIEALVRRCGHGIFGYTNVPEKYYEATINWFSRRHNWQIGRDWITPIPGIVSAVTHIVMALCGPTDKVIIQTPVYNCFFSSIRNAGNELLCNPLLRKGNSFCMDYGDLEKKASDPQAKLLILCNPHNPVGRVWSREELSRLGEICLRNNVTVLADEIHCEFVFPGITYTPFASISEEFSHNSITCSSPSKAFNIAGLQIANIVTERADWRRKIRKEMSVNEIGMVSPLGVDALTAAYNEGEDWLDELNAYIYENYRFMKEFCAERLPLFPITEMDGTYLVWMDCSTLGKPSEELAEELKQAGRLWLNAGTMYGEEGRDFLRWNIACPRATLLEGLTRFCSFVK